MIINSLSPPAISSAIWTAATRELTSLSGTMGETVTVNGLIVPGGVVDIFASSALQMNACSLVVTAGALSGVTVGILSGGTFFKGATFNANQSNYRMVCLPPSTASLRMLNNDIGNGANYCLISSYLT